MAILTDLPNELLLPVIADVSPLYMESFALSCKRIYCLCTDTLREHDLVRSRLANLQAMALLKTVASTPQMALYPKLVKLATPTPYWDGRLFSDLFDEIDILNVQSSYSHLLNLEDTRLWCAIVPLLITRLLHVQKMEMIVGRCRDLQKVISQIVEDSYEPNLAMKEPLALGTLIDLHILTPIPCPYHGGMELAVHFAAIPSLRKLRVDILAQWNTYTRSNQLHSSGLTEISIGRCVYTSFLEDLIGRTHSLQRFTYNHEVHSFGRKLEPRPLLDILKQRAARSLTYMNLLTQRASCTTDGCMDLRRNHGDLCSGSLRQFNVSKILVTFVDMFIMTRDLGVVEETGCYMNGTGTMQRLVSWLPASLETLVLHQGLEEWSKDDLRMLFRGFRNNKQARLPNLKLIILVKCPDFDQLISDDVKSACQEMGVKIGDSLDLVKTLDCRQIHEQLGNWEGLTLFKHVGYCCG